MIVFDTSAWIEYFLGSKKGEKVKRYIDSNGIILTPSLGLAELKTKYLQENRDFQQQVTFILKRSKIVVIDVTIALQTAEVKVKEKLYLIDAVMYAVALLSQAPLLTADKHFKHLSGVEFL